MKSEKQNRTTRTPVFSLLFIAFIIHTVPSAGVSASSESVPPRFAIEFEAGPVWQSRNDVQIPNDETGTRFSLIYLLGKGPFPAVRLYFTWNVNERHGLRIVMAPLIITGSSVLDSPVQFAGEHFDAGITTEATYKFNSWRVTYWYRFSKSTRFVWWIGFTAKIRDAKVQLEQPGASAKKTDVGFVPLLHISGGYRFAEQLQLMVDLDALAGGPGRAEDLSLKLRYDISERWSISGGYRMVEGGADVDEVYNFAWLHYAVFAGEFRF